MARVTGPRVSSKKSPWCPQTHHPQTRHPLCHKTSPAARCPPEPPPPVPQGRQTEQARLGKLSSQASSQGNDLLSLPPRALPEEQLPRRQPCVQSRCRVEAHAQKHRWSLHSRLRDLLSSWASSSKVGFLLVFPRNEACVLSSKAGFLLVFSRNEAYACAFSLKAGFLLVLPRKKASACLGHRLQPTTLVAFPDRSSSGLTSSSDDSARIGTWECAASRCS